jgi:hypothetical protein
VGSSPICSDITGERTECSNRSNRSGHPSLLEYNVALYVAHGHEYNVTL